VDTAPEPPPPPPKTALKPEEGIAKLQKQLDDERAARIAADQRAQEAANAEAEARGKAQTSQLDQIKGAIAQATQAKDVLKAKYAEAAAAGDWAAASEVQSQMADNAADLRDLKRGQTALESAPKPTPRAPSDPVEQFCAQLTAPSAAWVRAHPEFVRDNHKNQQMLAAHQLAIARGIKADTPEYFGSIEKTLDLVAPVTHTEPDTTGADDPMASAAKPSNGNGGRNAAPAAPVSRSGSGGGSRPNAVTLSREEAEMAYASFPHLDPKKAEIEYARNKIALKKEGKLS
jgi:hypothetical protein